MNGESDPTGPYHVLVLTDFDDHGVILGSVTMPDLIISDIRNNGVSVIFFNDQSELLPEQLPQF